MNATKKNRTNISRAARVRARQENTSYQAAVEALRKERGVPPRPTPATPKPPTLAAYLACYDGYSLDLVATDGHLTVHELGSTEQQGTDLSALPATAAPGELWTWFEPETYASECYRAGADVAVLSYDWSLRKADLTLSFGEPEQFEDLIDSVECDLDTLDPSGSCYQALLADARDQADAISRVAYYAQVRTRAQAWLEELAGR